MYYYCDMLMIAIRAVIMIMAILFGVDVE